MNLNAKELLPLVPHRTLNRKGRTFDFYPFFVKSIV